MEWKRYWELRQLIFLAKLRRNHYSQTKQYLKADEMAYKINQLKVKARQLRLLIIQKQNDGKGLPKRIQPVDRGTPATDDNIRTENLQRAEYQI